MWFPVLARWSAPLVGAAGRAFAHRSEAKMSLHVDKVRSAISVAVTNSYVLWEPGAELRFKRQMINCIFLRTTQSRWFFPWTANMKAFDDVRVQEASAGEGLYRRMWCKLNFSLSDVFDFVKAFTRRKHEAFSSWKIFQLNSRGQSRQRRARRFTADTFIPKVLATQQ